MRQLGRIARRAQLAATRRPPKPGWRKPLLMACLLLGTIGGLGLGGVLVMRYGVADTAKATLSREVLAVADRAGMQLKEIYVRGRGRTERSDLVQIVEYLYMQNILSVDVAALRERVEHLPWVHTASVKRLLPAKLVLELVEHRPLALWQPTPQDPVRLVSEAGVAVSVPDLNRYVQLPMLSGPGAAEAAPFLFRLLHTEPELASRVTGASLVGGRRWDVFIDEALTVRLPEEEPLRAWRRLARHDAEKGVLDLAVQAIDLRVPNRLILQLDERVLDAKGRAA